MKLLVTGGCGFIGSAVIRHLMRGDAHQVVNLDKLTYAASREALENAHGDARYQFVQADIVDRETVDAVLDEHRPDAIMHLAAESHVDRSIDGPGDFIRTNITGTYVLLEAARAYVSRLDAAQRTRFRFHHVSTDEVFGALAAGDAPFTESTAYDPRSPYSASKAASDHLARAWFHTYDLPVIVSNTTNNYGPWQFPEMTATSVTGCLSMTMRRRWVPSSSAVRSAGHTRSAPASHAATSTLFAPSVACSTSVFRRARRAPT